MTPPRRRCRFRRRRDLVERLAPYVQAVGPEPELLISVEPIRWWLEGWAAATGDPPEVIARGFGLGSDFVTALFAGRVRGLSRSDAADVCRSLDVDTEALWRSRWLY